MRWTSSAVAFFVLLTLSCGTASAQIPAFSTSVKTNDGRGILLDPIYRTVTASANNTGNAKSRSVVDIRVKYGGGEVRRIWTLYGSSPSIDGGKRFPLAKLRTTATFELKSESYIERIWNYDFDRYFNICVKGLKDVTAEGGNIYCSVYHAERVQYQQKTRVLKSYPRPKVVSSVTSWYAPICQPGATRVETSSLIEDRNQVCQDGIEVASSKYSAECVYPWDSYPQQNVTTILVPRLAGKPKTTTTTTIDCEQRATKGPGWVTASITPLPAPTVTVTSMTGPDSINYYDIEGTLVSNYRATCWIDILITNTDGVVKNAPYAYVARAEPGVSATWSTRWDADILGTPTSVAAGKPLCK
jgi:hypothetical protein